MDFASAGPSGWVVVRFRSQVKRQAEVRETIDDSTFTERGTGGFLSPRYCSPGQSCDYQDPTEEPILLLGSMFDANSLGKGINDWTVSTRGVSARTSQHVGEHGLLLLQLAGKPKHDREQSIPWKANPDNRKLAEGIIGQVADLSALSNEQHEPSFPAEKSSTRSKWKKRDSNLIFLSGFFSEFALQADRTRRDLIDTVSGAVIDLGRSASPSVGKNLVKIACRLGRSSNRAKPPALLVIMGLIQPALALPDFNQPLVIVPGVMAWASTLFSYLVNSQDAGDKWIQIGFCVWAGAVVSFFFFIILTRIFNDPMAIQSSTKLVSFFGGALFILRQTASDVSGLQLANHAILSVLIALTGEIFCIARLVNTPDDDSFIETATSMEDGRGSGAEAQNGSSSPES